MKNFLFLFISGFVLFVPACGPEAPKLPGESAFDAANNQIIASSDSSAFGNTSDAVKQAEKFWRFAELSGWNEPV